MSLYGAVSAQFKLILLEKCHGTVCYTDTACVDVARPELDARCVFHLFTALFGYFLIVTGSIAQIPVLFRVLRSPDYPVHRLSLVASVLTTSNYVAYAVHRNLPISTWGEGIFLLIQHVIALNLSNLYNGRHRNALIFMAVYTVVMVMLLWPFVPGYVLVGLKVLNIPLAIVTKSRLLYQRHKNKDLQNLPRKSSLLLLNIGCYGRILTSLVDARDVLMVLGYLEECVFNTVITVQTVRYKRFAHKSLSQDTKIAKQRGNG